MKKRDGEEGREYRGATFCKKFPPGPPLQKLLNQEYHEVWDTFDRYREETFLPLREELHEMALDISGDFGIPYTSVDDLKDGLERLEREARERGDNAEADRIQSILSAFESLHEDLLGCT